jgi:hypothetical protein
VASRERRPSAGTEPHDVSFDAANLGIVGARATAPERPLGGYLADAGRILRELDATPARRPSPDPKVPPEFERIRWFPLPSESLA